jgi:hypothetical protein
MNTDIDTIQPLADEDLDGIDEPMRQTVDFVEFATGSREFAIVLVKKIQDIKTGSVGSAWGFQDVIKSALDHGIDRTQMLTQNNNLIDVLNNHFASDLRPSRDMDAEWARIEADYAKEQHAAEVMRVLAAEFDEDADFALFFRNHLHWFDDRTDEKHTRNKCVEFIRKADSDNECLDIDDVVAALKRHVNIPESVVDAAREEYDRKVRDEVRDKLLRKIGSRYEGQQFAAFGVGAITLQIAAQGNCSAPPALWGAGLDVLWAEDESLIIESGFGVGKTTLAGKLALARLFGGDVLGYPVRPLSDGQKILYLALDRPQQIIRSMLRQFTPSQIAATGNRLIIHQGPIPADAAENDRLLVDLADYYEADDIFIDSVKDAALGLSEDRAAAIYQRGRQNLLRAGRQLVELHHLTKAGDAYGSIWLNAGVGSVVRLTGAPGGPTAILKQFKSPAHKIDPIKITHDRDNGEMHVTAKPATDGAATGESTVTGQDVPAKPEAAALPDWVAQHSDGVTAGQASQWLYGDGSEAAVKRAKRLLSALAADGILQHHEGSRGGDGRQQSGRWTIRGQE